MIVNLCLCICFSAQTVGNPLPSAFFEEQITTGRHPDDDKRYTIGMSHCYDYQFASFKHLLTTPCFLSKCLYILIFLLCCNFILTEQLNHAARHRNVYFDTVGGDPYGEKNINVKFLTGCIMLCLDSQSQNRSKQMASQKIKQKITKVNNTGGEGVGWRKNGEVKLDRLLNRKIRHANIYSQVKPIWCVYYCAKIACFYTP